ncbi:MAG: HAMP domain-containing sensor histidine kinase [Bacteroidota bacterium]
MPETPIPLWNRLGVRLAALFLALLVALGAAVLSLTERAVSEAVATTDQALHLDLASELAPRFQPHLNDAIDEATIGDIIAGLTQVNRRIDVYLLGGDGMIKSWFSDARGRPLEEVVATDALDEVLGGAMPPVLGPDPARPGEARPFSVAPISIMGEEGCYLYVILQGERYDDVAAMVWPGALGSAAARGLLVALALTALVGVFGFWALTRRLGRLTEAVGAVERGALSVRADAAGSDEVGVLGRAFNRMAARIEAQVDALRRTDQQRRDLVASVSHDLRSPLAALRGYLETLAIRGDTASGEEREMYVGRALRSSERLSALVSDLFDLARFDAAEVRPSPEPTALAELAADAVADRRPEADRREIRLRVRAEDGLPLATVDPGLVDRAVGNLLDNALRHTPPGGAVDVEVTRADASTLAVAVRDTGEGIAPELLPRVFDRFVRADESRAADGGAGLGLAIVKRIATLHGGTVRVESTLGAGSTFSLVLPVEARPAPEASIAATDAGEARAPARTLPEAD